MVRDFNKGYELVMVQFFAPMASDSSQPAQNAEIITIPVQVPVNIGDVAVAAMLKGLEDNLFPHLKEAGLDIQLPEKMKTAFYGALESFIKETKAAKNQSNLILPDTKIII